MNFADTIPWWAKIMAKLVLSRLPIDYRFWKKISVFAHGSMEQPDYAFKVFMKHFNEIKPSDGFVSLELGPGDSLFSALISRACGGTFSYLVDNGDFAVKDVGPYLAMAYFLDQNGLNAPDIFGLNSLDEILKKCNSTYSTQGLLSLREIPNDSVDYVWSHAVMEHIKRAQLFDTMQELRRIINNDGACSCRIDLRDHLGGALNNLRFSARVWESSLVANSGFHTNRIRYEEMVDYFKRAGFKVELVEVDRWIELPTKKSKMSKEYRNLPTDQLCIRGFHAILRPI